jgi:hypothetical protein
MVSASDLKLEVTGSIPVRGKRQFTTATDLRLVLKVCLIVDYAISP